VLGSRCINNSTGPNHTKFLTLPGGLDHHDVIHRLTHIISDIPRLAALIPPPRRHRHHYFGAFAPHLHWRARVTARAGQLVTGSVPVSVPGPDPALPAAYRRRASPELDAGFAFEFDQSQPWDRTDPPPDPGLSFDQTSN
jgi:hypothetical protein